MAGAVVVLVIASQASRADPAPAPTPLPSVVATAAHPTPMPSVQPTTTPAPDPFAFPRWAAVNVAVISLMLAIGVGVPVGIALHNWHRAKLLEPLNPPLSDREAVHRLYDVKSLEARRGWMPESLTYHYSTRNEPAVLEETPAPALALPGSVDDLLGHGHGLAYGWRVDNGELLVDRQIRSLLVGGVQGSGKTSFVALLVAQLVRQGARVMLADPDALNPQGLAYRLAGLGIQPEQTAHEPAAVLRLVLDAQHELMTRQGQGANADPRPYVVAIDEVPECLRVLNRHDSGLLQSALELIGALKGRKHAVSVIMLGQSWTKAVIGSTAARNLITSSAVFRMRSDEAKSMTNLRAEYWRTAGPDTIDLEPGMFYAVGIDSGAVLARVPELPSTLRPTLPATLPHPASYPARPASDGRSAGYLQGTEQGSPQGREAEILRLFKQGLGYPQIVQRLYPKAAGSRFKEARAEVEDAIRRGLR